MNELNPNNLQVGDEILVEQAWEDEAGNYHDEYAIITGINDGRLQLDFGKKEINEFLEGAEWEAKDFVAEKPHQHNFMRCDDCFCPKHLEPHCHPLD